ncbi:MAG: NUDIX domain-containing protein [Desulfococcaceae bacterium]
MKSDGRLHAAEAPPGGGAHQEMIRRSRNLCHELNQPMQAISGYADLLAIGIPPDHPQRPKVEKIRYAVKQANEIIGELASLIRSQDPEEAEMISADRSKRHSPRGFPMEQTYRNPPLAVDVIIETREGIVLIERKNPPLGWALPGGFVDYGETLENAAVREAREETSLDVALSEQFHAYSAPDRDPRQHTVTVVFLAAADGKPRAADDAKNLAVFPRGNLPSKLAFDHGRILADYFRYRDGASRKDIFPLP